MKKADKEWLQAFMAGYNLAMQSLDRVSKAYSSMSASGAPVQHDTVKPLPVIFHNDASELAAERASLPTVYDSPDGLGR